MKHKPFILGALSTSITWIIALFLYSQLSVEKGVRERSSPRFVAQNLADSAPPDDLGRIRSIEDKLLRDAGYEKHSFNAFISDRIGFRPLRQLPDTRDSRCLDRALTPNLVNTSVSVIMCFYNEHKTTLLRSIASIFERTPATVLREIVLIDDFSSTSDDALAADLKAFDGKVRMLRNSQRQGLIRSRVFGSRHAKGDILVFLDSHVEVNQGWIEPLIGPLVSNRSLVTVPVVDIINPDTFEYGSSPLVKGGFNWGLHFKWDPVPGVSPNSTDLIKTPTMPGGLFAVRREYFKEIGELDTGMDIWGGENLELSFRLWMCGGSIFIVPCSRVGHVFRKRRPYGSPSNADTLLRNNLRLANVWLDKYKEYFLGTFKTPPSVDFGDISERLELRKTLECRSFEWYHRNVYPDMEIPGNRSVSRTPEVLVQPWYARKRNYTASMSIHLVLNSNLCLLNLSKKSGKTGAKKGDPLALQKCDKRKKSAWFRTDKSELILNRLLCLEADVAQKGLKVFLNKCHEEKTQQWELKPGPGRSHSIYNQATGECLFPSKKGQVGDLVDVGICGSPSNSAVWRISLTH